MITIAKLRTSEIAHAYASAPCCFTSRRSSHCAISTIGHIFQPWPVCLTLHSSKPCLLKMNAPACSLLAGNLGWCKAWIWR